MKPEENKKCWVIINSDHLFVEPREGFLVKDSIYGFYFKTSNGFNIPFDDRYTFDNELNAWVAYLHTCESELRKRENSLKIQQDRVKSVRDKIAEIEFQGVKNDDI